MTSFLAAHGLWAVFVLMAIDAVFPAASELVMLYAGALASGALSDQLVVFGTERSGPDAYLAVALAGTIGYLLGAISTLLTITLSDNIAPFRDAVLFLIVMVVLTVRPDGIVRARGTVTRV